MNKLSDIMQFFSDSGVRLFVGERSPRQEGEPDQFNCPHAYISKFVEATIVFVNLGLVQWIPPKRGVTGCSCKVQLCADCNAKRKHKERKDAKDIMNGLVYSPREKPTPIISHKKYHLCYQAISDDPSA